MDVVDPEVQLNEKLLTNHGVVAAQHPSYYAYFSVKYPMFYMHCIIHFCRIMKERYKMLMTWMETAALVLSSQVGSRLASILREPLVVHHGFSKSRYNNIRPLSNTLNR